MVEAATTAEQDKPNKQPKTTQTKPQAWLWRGYWGTTPAPVTFTRPLLLIKNQDTGHTNSDLQRASRSTDSSATAVVQKNLRRLRGALQRCRRWCPLCASRCLLHPVMRSFERRSWLSKCATLPPLRPHARPRAHVLRPAWSRHPTRSAAESSATRTSRSSRWVRAAFGLVCCFSGVV